MSQSEDTNRDRATTRRLMNDPTLESKSQAEQKIGWDTARVPLVSIRSY